MHRSPNTDPAARTPAGQDDHLALQRLAAIVHASADGIIGETIDGIITDWNPAAERLYGYTAEEILGKSRTLLVPPEDIQNVAERLRRLRRGESIQGLEAVRRTRDGRLITVSLTISPVWNDDGEIVSTSIIARDITARIATQAALATSLELFRVAFANAPIGMVLADPDVQTVQINPAMCAMLGYTEDELLARDVWDWTHPDDRDANREALARALAGEFSAYEMEKRYVHRDGHTVWGYLRGTVVRDAEGVPRYVVSQTQDITARKAAEAEYTATHVRMQQVLERITDGFYALDRNWRFTYVNPAAERMFGRPQAQLLGKTLWDVFPPTVTTPLYPGFHQAFRDGQAATIEMDYPPFDGWFEVRVFPSADGISVFFRNVSEERKYLRELQASESTFRTLVEQLPMVVYLQEADAVQTPRYFSPRYEQVTGYTVEEALHRTAHWLEFVHPEDRDRIAAAFAESQATQTPFAEDYRYLCKDGRMLWVRDRCDAILDPSGTATAWLGTILDITDQREAEAMQARLAAIVESAADGILSVARDGTILSWNRGAELLYGYAAAEAIGQDVIMLRPPDARDDIANSIERAWQGEIIAEQEAPRLTKDGRRILVSVTLFPLRDAHGDIVAISSISRDLTALRQTQDALRLRDRALDATRNGIVITDPTLPGNPIVDINPAFTDLTGYSRAEVLGRNCRFLQGPDTDPVVVDRIRAAHETHSDSFETLLNYRKDGSSFWNDLSIAAVRDAAGAVTHYIGVLSDATERKGHELELEIALEAAEAGMRAKTQFLAMMSHELRTPLQAVLGYAHFLLHSPSGSLTPEQREDVHAIQLSAGRMVTLIEQLLDLTRMEAGRLDLAPEPVALPAILDQVQQDVAPMLASKDLAFTVNLPNRLPPLQCDPNRLRQILLNLVGNAVKFTDAGEITVEVAANGADAAIEIRDTGIGIAPEALPHIFEEFRQVDGSLTRRYGGAGLGLAISQRLAEQMDGAITVASEEGVGSAFTLRLPLASPG
ncbi:MAG: PAS domain S-box protein [Thermomicrobiales bacterium]